MTHLERLEAPVADSTHDGFADELGAQLRASEERFRLLFLQEQRRARHLSLINEVQKCALATRDIEAFLPQVTRAIGSHFADCDVTLWAGARCFGAMLSIFLAPKQENVGEMTAIAGSGEHGLGAPVGTRAAPAEPDGGAPAPHPEAHSQLSVPLVIEGETCGSLCVQSRENDVLDARDVAALQTAAGIIAAHLQNSRLFRNMSEINDFNQGLLNSMLHSLLVVDESGRIQFVNDRLLQTFGRTHDLKKQPLEAVLGDGPVVHHRLREIIAEVLESGEGREVPELHVWTPAGAQIFDVRLFRVFFRGQAEAALLLINLTQRWRKTYQLQLMHEIGRLFQGSLDIERVLSTVLTCITAGSALGFNRAFVCLWDETSGRLEGRMALGPSSADEAARIWSEISQREFTLTELLKQGGAITELTPLQERTRELRIRVSNAGFPAVHRALEQKSAILATSEEMFDFGGVDESAREEVRRAAQLLCASEVAIAPLVAKERLVGLVFADNLYSGSPIDEDDVQLLDTLAQQAGLTIDNALTYQDLRDAQKELVSAERLVAVGEMAARVSHEIRNPLATIGGFARSVFKKPDDVESVKRKTGVVISEVARLEELLTDLLDMARPRPLDLQPQSVNELLEHALLLAEADLRMHGATLVRELAPELPPARLDRSRILQALLNTIRNGAQAMTTPGTLRVATRLSIPTPDVSSTNDSDLAHDVSSTKEIRWLKSKSPIRAWAFRRAR
jgi:nitrogen-specific signal transduction histidine kinase